MIVFSPTDFADYPEGGSEDDHPKVERGATPEDGSPRRTVRANDRRHAAETIGQFFFPIIEFAELSFVIGLILSTEMVDMVDKSLLLLRTWKISIV